MLWYSLEVSGWGTSDEYPQQVFLEKYKNFLLLPGAVKTYDNNNGHYTGKSMMNQMSKINLYIDTVLSESLVYNNFHKV